MRSNDEYINFLERNGVRTLKNFSDFSNRPTSLDDIIPGETYGIEASELRAIEKGFTWLKVAIEDEMLLAVTNFVNEMYKLPIKIFPTRTMYKNKNPIMEWDRIIVCDNKVFLLESEHEMTKVCKKLLTIMNFCKLLIT